MTVTDVRTSPAREDLCRNADFELTRASEGTDGLTIEGYGAVFNSPTRINGWEGDFEETIAPGAFKRSLRARAPRMQFDHGQHPLLGSLPLGLWTVAEEDERGLHLVGRLTDNWLVLPFRDAIRDGGVEGMSFRFAVVQDDWTDAKGTRIRDDELMGLLYDGGGARGPIRRTLKEVKVSEAGPVVWPAYEDTAVGVRSKGTVVIDLARLREPAQRRQLAEAVAFADAVEGRGGYDPKWVAAAMSGTPEKLTADQLTSMTYSNYALLRQRTMDSLINAGFTPESVDAWIKRGAIGIDDLKHTGKVSAHAGKISVQLQPKRSDDTKPAPVAAQPPENVPVGSPNVEQQVEVEQPDPQSTAPPTDNHSTQQVDPEVTGRASGEHSAPPIRPVNPTERAAVIRAEYRNRLTRLMAIQKTTQEGVDAT